MQPLRVLYRRGRVVNRAGTTYHEETVGALGDDFDGVEAAFKDSAEGMVGLQRKAGLVHTGRRRD